MSFSAGAEGKGSADRVGSDLKLILNTIFIIRLLLCDLSRQRANLSCLLLKTARSQSGQIILTEEYIDLNNKVIGALPQLYPNLPTSLPCRCF